MASCIVLNLPAHGHLNPTLPLVAELVRRGERVIYYGTEAFRPQIERTGATFSQYAGNAHFDTAETKGGPFGLMARSIAATELLLPALLPELRAQKPDYLILDSMCVWGRLAQQVLDRPAVTSCTTFALNRKILLKLARPGAPQPPLRDVAAGILPLLRYVRTARRIDRRYGTRSPGLFEFFINRQALNLVYTSATFQPHAESFDQTYRFVGPSVAPRNEQSDFPFHRLGADPLIYISMGTIFNDVADFYRACFSAFADSQFRVVLSVGNKVDLQALGPVPRNVVVQRYIPQLELLQRADLFITHGGMNSVSEALLHRVPLLVVPQVGDQFMVADRLHRLGLGLHLPRARVTAERLRAMAEQLTTMPNFRDRAAAMSDSLRMAGGFVRAADEIFAFKRRIGLRD